MMDVSREDVKKIIDFLRENPDMAREFGVVIHPALDERLDSFERTMEKRFAEANARFLALDDKFDALIKEMHEGFEAVNKRLEVQELRLDAHDRKFDSLIKEMHDGFDAANKKFAEHDRKFDSLIKEMHDGFDAANKKFAEHDRKFDSLIKEMHDGFAVASKERSSLGNTLGKLIENRVADRVEDFAEKRGWKISSRTVSEGEEVDLMVRDGLKFFVETKSHADRDALEQTLRKAKKLKMPGILVGERMDRGVVKEAKLKNLLCLNLREFRNALESGKIERFLSK